MAASVKSVKRFYQMIKPNVYKKNWRDAPALKDMTMAFAFVMSAIVMLASASRVI